MEYESPSPRASRNPSPQAPGNPPPDAPGNPPPDAPRTPSPLRVPKVNPLAVDTASPLLDEPRAGFQAADLAFYLDSKKNWSKAKFARGYDTTLKWIQSAIDDCAGLLKDEELEEARLGTAADKLKLEPIIKKLKARYPFFNIEHNSDGVLVPNAWKSQAAFGFVRWVLTDLRHSPKKFDPLQPTTPRRMHRGKRAASESPSPEPKRLKKTKQYLRDMFLVVEDVESNDEVFDLPDVAIPRIPLREFEARAKVARPANMELDLSCMKFNVLRTIVKEQEQRFNNRTEMIVYQLNRVVRKEIKNDEGLREALAVLYRNAGPKDLDLRMKIVSRSMGRRAL